MPRNGVLPTNVGEYIIRNESTLNFLTSASNSTINQFKCIIWGMEYRHVMNTNKGTGSGRVDGRSRRERLVERNRRSQDK